MKADCFLDNALVGKASLDTLLIMPANQEAAIPISANIGMSQIISNSIRFLLGSELMYSVQGTAKAGKGGIKWNIPFTQSGKLDKSVIKKLFR